MVCSKFGDLVVCGSIGIALLTT
ncbi:hypothetical protein M2F96_21190 [Vibrio vulnificus]|nr:hypothetical protein [Vibrio vulnificus]MCU8212384.1 hypothetical protein [Vibrio vulnificus]MCU8234173.1 hypothetical protein [Vibrio vulnificus]MCU8260509.1 hypothetical protein [Vibrio vulnificus]MCU8295482.1 hypothetical protein [Vibrio vulnificus]MCU8322227.1 hypothetical protein [Vibrio vulnificus]